METDGAAGSPRRFHQEAVTATCSKLNLKTSLKRTRREEIKDVLLEQLEFGGQPIEACALEMRVRPGDVM